MGESKNTIRKLADVREDVRPCAFACSTQRSGFNMFLMSQVELFELADEVGGALQLTDQYAYDNVFIKFQPGSGKVLIKEPKAVCSVSAPSSHITCDLTEFLRVFI